MNPLFDPIGFDPLEQIERSAELVPVDSTMPVDLLDVISARLEESIEQPPIPEFDAFADPLARTLDRVEASVEGPRCGMPQFGPDPLLDQAEMDTERQVTSPESGATNSESDPRSAEKHRPLTGLWSGDHQDMAHPARERPRSRDYIRRPSGSGSGIRAPTTMVYCTLRQEWVDVGECRECPDFEPADVSAGDDEEYCRHAWDGED